MEPEYRLDALLSARERRRVSSGAAPADEELQSHLAAADRLNELRRAAPAPDFARALGARLRARADQLRVMQAYSEQAQDGRRLVDAPLATPTASRRPVPIAVWRWRPPRRLQPALAAAAAVLLVGVGVATYAASQAGPGNPLYFVHRVQQDVQVQLASSQSDRVRLHLTYAAEALSQLDAAAQHHDRSGYATALTTLTGEAAAANQALVAVPAGSDHNTLVAQVAGLQSQMRRDLTANLAVLDWTNRLSTSATLGTLGVAVPHVAAATIVRQSNGNGDGNGQGNGDGPGSSSHGDQVTVSGGGFASGAALVVDGQTAKVVTISVAPTQLVAVVADAGVEQAHSIGVINPDGTAAQTTNVTAPHPDAGGNDNGGNGKGGNDNHSGATPTPTDASGDHGGHGGDGHGP